MKAWNRRRGCTRARCGEYTAKNLWGGIYIPTCSGAALPGNALTVRNCQGTVLCTATSLGVLPWPILYQYSLLPSPPGKCWPSAVCIVLVGDVSREGVCPAWCCAKRLDHAWAFIKTASFIRGCLQRFWVCKLVSAVRNAYFSTSGHPASTELWKKGAISQLLWLWAHCDVFSSLVGLAHVFSLAEKGTFLMYIAGTGSNDCDFEWKHEITGKPARLNVPSHSCKCESLVTRSFPIVHQLTTLIGIGIFSCHNQSQPLPSHIKLGRFKLFSADFLHTPPEITKQPETAQVAVK